VRHSRPPFSGQHQKSSLGGCFIQRQTRTRTKDEFCLRLRCVESNTVTRFSEGAVRRTASTALSESKKKDTHLFGQSDRGRNHPPQPVIRSETPLFSFAGGKAAFVCFAVNTQNRPRVVVPRKDKRGRGRVLLAAPLWEST
jgi:hypothetical protein